MKKRNSKSLSKFILFLLVFLPIYQDSPFSLVLGGAGYYILMPVSLILYGITALTRKRRYKNEYLGIIIKIGLWLTIVSFVAIVIWILLGNPIYVVGEFLPVKAIKTILQYMSFPAYLYMLLSTLKKTGIDPLFKYSFFTLVMLTVICILENRQIPYAFSSLHFAGSFPYNRIRLLCTEASWTVLLIFNYSLFSIYYAVINKNRIMLAISCICGITLFYLSGSRSTLISIAVMIIIYVILSARMLNEKTIIAMIISAGGLIWFSNAILPILSSSFATDINEWTSLSTRLYTSILGLAIGVVIPTGVGGAVYLGVYQAALSKYLNYFRNTFPTMKVGEIMSLISKNSDLALTVKSGFLQYHMYWGLVGSIMLIKAFVKLTKAILNDKEIKGSEILAAGFWTNVVLLLSAPNLPFEFWLFFGILIYLSSLNTYQDRKVTHDISYKLHQSRNSAC